MNKEQLFLLESAYSLLKKYKESDNMEDMKMEIIQLKLEMAQTKKDIDKVSNQLECVSKLPTRMELWSAVIAIVVPLIILIASK